jgi:thioredoxin reductase (NADPH)
MELYDITIIGAGPAGLFAAFYAGLRQAKTLVIDSLPQLGGQLTTLYPEKNIYDVAGFPKVKAADLITNLHKQLEGFPHSYRLNENVQTFEQTEEGHWHVTTDKNSYLTKTIVIATGMGAFQPRKLNLAGAEELENRGIDYFVNDAMKFAGKKVAIAGGGDSALDWALLLESIADTVYLIHRRDAFRGHESTAERVKKSNIQVLTPYTITQLKSEAHHLTGATLQLVKGEENVELELDHLIVNYGFATNQKYLKTWGLKTDRGGILVNSDMSSSLPGIYACGDITSYPGKVNLIAAGFGEAPTAVNNALHFAEPSSRTQPPHSSSLFAASGIIKEAPNKK